MAKFMLAAVAAAVIFPAAHAFGTQAKMCFDDVDDLKTKIDASATCVRFKQAGWCTSKPAMAKSNCKKTCAMCNAATGAAPTVAPGRAPTNEPTPNNGGTDEPTTAGGSASGDGDPVPPPVDPMCVDRMVLKQMSEL